MVKGNEFTPRHFWIVIPAALLWLLSHPYAGIYHDARVYALTAAHWINPASLADDLFFKFGSQGDLSLFTPLYGLAIELIGLDAAARWVTLGGGIAWILSLAYLARSILGDGIFTDFAILFGAASSLNYSPNGATFLLNENFATARSLAMPLGILAVAFLFAKKERAGLITSFISLCLHPLVGIWPLLLTLSLRLRISWLVVAALGSIVGIVSIECLDLPLPGLHLMSAERLEPFRTSGFDVDVLVGWPGAMRLNAYLSVLACLFLGWRAGSAKERTLSLRLMLITATALLSAMLVSYWWPIEFLVQVQLWRVFGLALPIGGLLFMNVVRLGCERFPGLRLILCVVAPVSLMYPALFAPLVFLMATLFNHTKIGAAMSQFCVWSEMHRNRLIAGAIVFWLLALPGFFEEWAMAGYHMGIPWWKGADWVHGLIAGGTWPIPLFLANVLQSRKMSRWVLIVLGAAFIWVVPNWDHRSNVRKQNEHCYLTMDCSAHPFTRFIREGETVYWKDMELFLWFRLSATSYVSGLQGVGRVFSERKHQEWVRRNAFASSAEVHPLGTAMVCADPVINWAVVSMPVDGVSPQITTAEGHLYSCKSLRAVLQAHESNPEA